MKVEDIRRIIQVSVLGVIGVATAKVYLSDDTPFSMAGWRAVQLGITVIMVFWAFFFRCGWRWPVFRRLFNRPDLNGTWIGMFSTDWKDENGHSPPPQRMAVVIRQTFLTLHISSFTERLVAHSYAENLILELERGLRYIAYLYAKDTTSIGDPGNREGAAEFRIIEGDRSELIGHYWSNQKTCGRISLRRAGSEHVSSYEDAKRRWNQGDWDGQLR